MKLSFCKQFFIILILFFITIQAQPQELYKISGKVISEETGEPIPFVNVFLDATTLVQNSKNAAYLARETIRLLIP